MSFVYNEEKLNATIKGQAYEFRPPTAREQREITRAFKEANEDSDIVGIYTEFFTKLGLPSEALEEMTMRGLSDLFGYSIGSKKN